MNKYIITFAKEGYLKYISHLDLMRLFERTLKRANIHLQYSQGFNPHPKIVFAQPLSLGYIGENEIVEIETKEELDIEFIRDALCKTLPIGIRIKSVEIPNEQGKTLASRTKKAKYTIIFPLKRSKIDCYANNDGIGLQSNTQKQITNDDFDINTNNDTNIMDMNPLEVQSLEDIKTKFLAQEQIIAQKKKKKTGKMADIDIKPMILSLELSVCDKLIMETIVAQGSQENLSPELLITAFTSFTGLECDRSEIEVIRNQLYFDR